VKKRQRTQRGAETVKMDVESFLGAEDPPGEEGKRNRTHRALPQSAP